MQEAVERLAAQSVDAIVALATYADAFAAVQRGADAVPWSPCRLSPTRRPAVWVDQDAGARLATRHLLDLGHRTLLHVAGPERSRWTPAAGSRGGARRCAPRVSPRGSRCVGDWTPASGHEAGRRIGEMLRSGADRITAVFVGNDQMALGVLKALHEAGISVPGTSAWWGSTTSRGLLLHPGPDHRPPGLRRARGVRGMGLALSSTPDVAGGVDPASRRRWWTGRPPPLVDGEKGVAAGRCER